MALHPDILSIILHNLDPFSYAKCVMLSKDFHIHLQNEQALELYRKNKYIGYSLKNLIDKGDVEGVKYKVDKDPTDICNDIIYITPKNCKNIGEIITILGNIDNYSCDISLNFKQNINKYQHPFKKPVSLSPQLYDLLNITYDTKMSRVDASKCVWEYIKNNCPKGASYYYPNESIMALFNIDKNTQLSYGSMQKYLKYHFI